MFLAVCIGLNAEDAVASFKLGLCSPLFMACIRFLLYRLRSTEHLEGLPGLRLHQHENVRLGNALANYGQRNFAV